MTATAQAEVYLWAERSDRRYRSPLSITAASSPIWGPMSRRGSNFRAPFNNDRNCSSGSLPMGRTFRSEISISVIDNGCVLANLGSDEQAWIKLPRSLQQ